MVESFFATLKTELLDQEVFRTRAQARAAIFEYIEVWYRSLVQKSGTEVWYNRQRRHSTLGYVSPAEFERNAA